MPDDNVGIQQGTKPLLLQDVFSRNGSPFSLGIKPLQDLDNIIEDPAVKEILDSNPDVRVITDSEIRTLIEMTGEPDYFEKTESFKAMRQYSERKEYMAEFVDKFMNVLRVEDPELHDLFGQYIDQRAQISHEHYGSIHNRSLEEFQVTVAFAEIKKLESSYSVRDLEATEESPSMRLLKIPDETYDRLRDSSDNTGRTKDQGVLALINNPPPGTNQDYIALIIAHEVGHVVDKGRSPQQNYFDDVTQDAEDHNLADVALEGNVIHANETDQDLTMYGAVGHLVSPDAVEYWAARRIALQSNSFLKNIDLSSAPEETPQNDLNIHFQHETGFYLLEFMKTGEIPDYYFTTSSINSFYNTTADTIRETLDNMKQQHGVAPNADTKLEINHGMYISAVENALNAEPSVYSPAEQVIAQHYLHSMQDVLGINKANLVQSIGDNITQYQTSTLMANDAEVPLPDSVTTR